MKKVIWKFPINTTDSQEISMPKDAEILCVQTQFNEPCIWALVNEGYTEFKTIEVFGTGHEIHYDMGVERKYIGTYQLDDGNFVFHVFERIN